MYPSMVFCVCKWQVLYLEKLLTMKVCALSFDDKNEHKKKNVQKLRRLPDKNNNVMHMASCKVHWPIGYARYMCAHNMHACEKMGHTHMSSDS